MFKCNRDIVDLIDLLSAVENEAEAFGRLVKGQIEILACDGFWTFKVKYGTNKERNYYHDYETLEDMRKDIATMTLAAKITCWEEV